MTESGAVSRTPRPAGVRGARRAAIVALVVSLSITAIIGIAVLLTGSFGELQGRVLGTTLTIAGFSILALCHLAVVGRPVRVVGFAGLAVSAIALALGLVLIWMPWSSWSGGLGDVWRWFGITGILAVSLAHANLLLLLASRRQPVIRVAMAITLVAIALVALLIILPIVSDGRIPGSAWDAYWRWLGVIAIIDVLGTVTLPVVALLSRDKPNADPDPRESAAALDARIASLASANGLDREALLSQALDAFEARRADTAASRPDAER